MFILKLSRLLFLWFPKEKTRSLQVSNTHSQLNSWNKSSTEFSIVGHAI